MKKIILLCLFCPAIVFANNLSTKPQKKLEPKIIKTETIKQWLIEDKTTVLQKMKINYFDASIISTKKELKIEISCYFTETLENGKYNRLKNNTNNFKVKIINLKDNFITEEQRLHFVFDKTQESVFVQPVPIIDENNKLLSFDKKLMTVFEGKNKNYHYHLANQIGINKKLTINYKTDKNIKKDIEFDLDGSYKAISYLGSQCFTK